MSGLKLLRNLLTNWIGHGLNVVVLFFLTPFVIDQLTAPHYGVWSTLVMLTGYLGVLDIGIRSSTGRFIVFYLGRADVTGVNDTVRTSLGFFAVAAAVIMTAAVALGLIMPHYLKDMPQELFGQFPLLMPLVALNTWLAAVSVVYSSVLTGHDRFDLMQGINILVLLLRTVGTIYVLLAGYGLLGLALITLLSNIVALLANIVLAHRLYPPLRSWPLMLHRERLKELFGFGIPAFISTIGTRILNHTDMLLIGLLLSVTLVTEYSICAMLILYVWGFLELIVGTMFPSIQRAAARGQMGDVRTLVLRMSRLTVVIGLLPYLGFVIFGREFLGLWVPTLETMVGEAAIVLSVLAVARLIALFSEGLSPALQAVGIVRTPAALAIIESALNALLSLLLVWRFGVVGIAGGTLAAMAVMRGVVVPLYAFGKLQIRIAAFLRQVVLPALLVAASFLAVCAIIVLTMPAGTWGAFFIKIGIAAAAYGLIALLMLVGGGERRQTLAALLKPLRRRQEAEA